MCFQQAEENMAQLDVAQPQEPSKLLQELKVNFEQQFLKAMQKAK